MRRDQNTFTIRIASSPEDVAAAQRLRYRVFVEEMGAHASPEDAALRLERDAFDAYFDHLILIDEAARPEDPLDRVVGAYRLMRSDVARSGPGFYGQSEYDLSLLLDGPRASVELGRSCVHPDYRGGLAMHLLWSAVGEYVIRNDVEILFGVASFHGADPEPLAEPLSMLWQNHLAPPDLRVRTLPEHYVEMNRIPRERIDHKRAMLAVPSLIKAYLRLGGFVGDGAYCDHAFNTVDVCLVMDTGRMQARYRDYYGRTEGILE
ncbi:GNAT family N-acetyltransferase [Oceanicella sp. SM1341]|uniref:GNAT family N-acetyltransferase n=1 Tax=Oceanicella sp. SM1341 TaxID=1548889 RepID=UPI000E4AC997|nr:GNAT family N-acyltransferase [Oceanicella sp. SM1341]